MITRLVPSSGEMIPVIGLGTWQTFDVGNSSTERKPLEDVISTFVELGGKLVDYSPMYGRSEHVVGDLIDKLKIREKLFIATKVWISGREAGVAQMNDSMEKMRARPLDLMQVHNLLDVETHLKTLSEWKKEKRVRYVGITHYTARAHEDVMRVMRAHTLDFVQINYSVGEREAEERLLPLALERGIAVIVNRPFATGALLKRLQKKTLPAWAAEIGCDSWAQVLLKFVVSHPAVTCAIPATSSIVHLRDNMKAGAGPLPDAKLRQRIVADVA